METREFYKIALRMISRKPLTKKELIQRLRRKKASPNQIDQVVEELARKDFIDEKAIAEDYIRRSRGTKLISRFLVRYELEKRGIKPVVFEDILEAEYPEHVEIEVSLAFAKQKLRSCADQPAEVIYRRVGSALGRRGFANDTIRKTLDLLEIKPYGDIDSASN